jgi:hypothetical protein
MDSMSILLALLATASLQDEKKPIEWDQLEAGPVDRGGKVAHGTRVKVTLRNGNTLRGFVVHPEFLREVDPKRWAFTAGAIRMYGEFQEGSTAEQQAGKKWGAERLSMIKKKKNAGEALRKDEQEFLDGYERWLLGRQKRHDFSRATTVVLDISLEQPQLGGHVVLKKTELRMPIIELSALDPKKLAELEAERDRVRGEMAKALDEFEKRREEERKKEDEARKKAGTGEPTDPIDANIKKLEELKAAKAFFDKYPEGSEEDQAAGKAWGPGRLKAIQDKARNNQPLTEEEKDFMSNYDQWTLGKKYTDELKKEEEKKKEEGGNP